MSESDLEEIIKGKDVDTLLQIMEMDLDEKSVRWKTAEALRDIGDPKTVEPLIQMLRNKDEYVRAAAANGLEIDHERCPETKNALDSLIECLGDEHVMVKIAAIKALGAIGERKGIEPLLDVINKEEQDSRVRSFVLESLKRFGDEKRVLDKIIEHLGDQNWSVRMTAAESLGFIGDRSAVDSLIPSLNDEEDQVRINTIWALGKIMDERALQPLLNILDGDAKGEERKLAEKAVKRIEVNKDAAKSGNVKGEGKDPITQFIDGISFTTKSVFSFDVIEMLAKMNPPHAMNALIAAVEQDETDVREKVISALESMANKRMLESLKSDKDDIMDEPAVPVSIDINDDRVFNAVVVAISDDKMDQSARKSAVSYLGCMGEMGETRAVQPLLDALNDEAWSVQFQAAGSLLAVHGKGNIDKKYSQLIRESENKIDSILPRERLETMRERGLWPMT